MKWHPIETEPKDGNPFLGFYDDWQCVMIYDRGNRRYLTDDGRNFAYPTYWMSLPPPPPGAY